MGSRAGCGGWFRDFCSFELGVVRPWVFFFFTEKIRAKERQSDWIRETQ